MDNIFLLKQFKKEPQNLFYLGEGMILLLNATNF